MPKISLHAGYLPGAIGRITELHGTYYAQHWDFGLFFEAKAATKISEFPGRFDQHHNGLWLALQNGNIVGSIVIDGGKADTVGARLRWFMEW